MAKKERIDVLLVEQGFFESREKAKKNIMAGLVYVNNEKVDKPGEKVKTDKEIRVKGNVIPYVGRGGLKLEKAIHSFNLDLSGKIMVDIGSSTGGFTDCALMNGAKMVYAIDVGYNQLAWKLRSDERVVVMERTNFRHVIPDHFKFGSPEFASIDVSFISLRLILPVLKTVIKKTGEVVALIKPQFEAGKELVGKKGIVRDQKVHIHVVDDLLSFALETGFSVLDLTYSPIRGGEGNIEFLVHLKESKEATMNETIDVREIVSSAHNLK
ncbi:TlyA family RNA methyltransferase [Haloplasma contractile]|uniref:3-oxoacyl-acyl-carrier protein reductase n=1 Tax=Haloplasma contractile SSD-17B TaxID=1033810 RepID=U2E013_9MOLU|nr:TlyA family RNA methyltransferase [Haloplasma contractile]ERJ13772.1 3-oxoacyl-acyl-carrier protein reductase [Haloplasma contractile SSD-17B]